MTTLSQPVGEPAAVEPVQARPRPLASCALDRLAALVILGGSVRPTQLTAAIDRSLLDLPLATGRTLLQHWNAHAIDLARALRRERLPVRVMIDSDAVMPNVPVAGEQAVMSVERDPYDFRGTGGLLRDLAVDYDPDDFILVANAAQVLLEPLPELALRMSDTGADVSLVAHHGGIPVGLMLIRRRCLDLIAPIGFVDMKEQALPAIARQHRVNVVRLEEPAGMPVRTLANYVEALRAYHEHLAGKLHAGWAFEEDWHPAFALIEEGASVHPTARVHDSVVLRGAHVEADAVLVHSLICPAASVGRRQRVVNQVFTGGR